MEKKGILLKHMKTNQFMYVCSIFDITNSPL